MAGRRPLVEDLPRVVPIFPLPGVLLLPYARLPLNIFEPRYLAMVRDALAADRLIGMVQPSNTQSAGARPPVYGIGCAGRITAFNETDDGRFLITLTGLCRFAVEAELPLKDGYRRIKADWAQFLDDLARADDAVVDRARLLRVLRDYFAAQDISANWPAIEKAAGGDLVTMLAMVCPFSAAEKQALLEASGLGERAELLISLLAMAVLDRDGPGAGAN